MEPREEAKDENANPNLAKADADMEQPVKRSPRKLRSSANKADVEFPVALSVTRKVMKGMNLK
jgi:hypothetical protein